LRVAQTRWERQHSEKVLARARARQPGLSGTADTRNR
jgi:hypothetical protein